jgi:predicted ATPase
MMRIDKLEISIEAYANNDHNDIRHFGRVLDFASGLNLVVGDNTSGKTTLVECLFYALAMEELIEGKPCDKTLDKAVKSQFLYMEPDGNQHEWLVKESFVQIQLSNTNEETITVKRKIVSDDKQQNKMYVWHSPILDKMEHKDCREYYIHNRDDHNTEHNEGFYALLADFADLPIIPVPARNTDKTIFYMQTVFTASYIEQKRGWSDFFANIRSYNIINPKQKLVEYLMGYDTNTDLINSIGLKEKRKKLENLWDTKVTAVKNYLSYNGLYTDGLQTEIKQQKIELDELRIAVRSENVEIYTYKERLKQRIQELENKQKSSQVGNGYELYLVVLKRYEQHIEEYKNYCIELVTEADKLDNIREHIKYIESEMKRYDSLRKVNNIITTLDVKICPTCHQHLPSDTSTQSALTSSQIQASRDMLSMQRSFLMPMVKRLEAALKNKELNKLYLDKQLRKEEVEVKMMASQNNINLYPLSTNEQFELVDCKTKVVTLDEVELHTREQIEQLSHIKNDYQQVCGKIKKLGDMEEDDLPTAQMLSAFRKLLNKFNYTSNNVINEVFFKEEDTTYKYLPVIKHGENNEEEIRADSSASDFIRSIWAYYLTLLTESKRHPGFLVMDEPCQHSMKEESLTHLFEVCASITDKQTILFCSSQPKTEENEEEKDEQSPNLIEELSNMLKEKGLNFNYIGIDPKAITLIND